MERSSGGQAIPGLNGKPLGVLSGGETCFYLHFGKNGEVETCTEAPPVVQEGLRFRMFLKGEDTRIL